MMNELKEPHIATIKDAAQKLTGAKRRAFQAQGTLDSHNGSARRAAAVFGWSRRTGLLGLHELRTGITCVDNTAARGNRTTEENWPQLAEDMRSLAEPHRQVDPKAKLNVGAFSRGGTSRGSEAIQAWDHDLRPKQKLVPCGILEVLGGLLTLIFGTSRETSDLLVDGLQQGWDLSKDQYLPMRQLVIDLDNGPQNASVRTQCMHRMVECADRNAVEVVLVSYPPYHSKYNPIERCWGILE